MYLKGNFSNICSPKSHLYLNMGRMISKAWSTVCCSLNGFTQQFSRGNDQSGCSLLDTLPVYDGSSERKTTEMFLNKTCGSGGRELLIIRGKSRCNWTEGQRVVGCFQISGV